MDPSFRSSQDFPFPSQAVKRHRMSLISSYSQQSADWFGIENRIHRRAHAWVPGENPHYGCAHLDGIGPIVWWFTSEGRWYSRSLVYMKSFPPNPPNGFGGPPKPPPPPPPGNRGPPPRLSRGAPPGPTGSYRAPGGAEGS